MLLRAIFALGVSFTLFAGLGAVSAQDDKKKEEKPKEPAKEKEILGKTIAQWIKTLREDEDPKLRWAAVKVLSISDAASTSAMPAILDAMAKDKAEKVRIEAIAVVSGFDPKQRPGAIKAIIASLQNDKDGPVREAAATALGSVKVIEYKAVFDYVTDIAASLKDPHEGTRVAVATTLRNMGEAAKPAVPALLDAAANPKEPALVRVAAIHVVSRFGNDNSKTAPLLVAIAKDASNSFAVREIALEGLGRSSGAGDVVTILTDSLNEKNVELRKAGAVSLGALGAKAKSSWPAVKEHLTYREQKDSSRLVPTQPDSSVRNHLIRLSGVLGKSIPEAVTVLTSVAVNDDSTENRIAAIQELGELGSLAKTAVAALSNIAAQDGRATVRDAASKAVKNINAP